MPDTAREEDLEKASWEYYVRWCATRNYIPYPQARLTALEEENTRLRKALEPFAKAAEIKLCGEWKDNERFGHTDIAFHLTFGDLRNAARTLSSMEKKKDDSPV